MEWRYAQGFFLVSLIYLYVLTANDSVFFQLHFLYFIINYVESNGGKMAVTIINGLDLL